MHDLLIKGGKIVDGSGSQPFMGDLAIDAGKITAVGKINDSAKRTIDADGQLVTPGWVDMHTHYDGQVTWDPYLSPSSWHGCTTVIMGNCGVGFAPVRPTDHRALMKLMEGVEDIPEIALDEGLKWNWETFPDFLDAIEGMPRVLDVGIQIAHGPVRVYVMGERGAKNEASTAEDIAEMRKIVREALKAGALGFSTSRFLGHRSSDGEPVPGSFANGDEIAGILDAFVDAGTGFFQIVAGGGIDQEDLYANIRKYATEHKIPMSMNLAQVNESPDSYRRALNWFNELAEQGAPVFGLVSGRTTGVLMCVEGTVFPFKDRPTYKQLAKLPFAVRVAELSKPEVKAKILSEPPTSKDEWWLTMLKELKDTFDLGDPPEYEPPHEQSLGYLAEQTGTTVESLAYDIMLSKEGKGMIYYPLFNYSYGSMDPVLEMLEHPRTVLGLSDGGAHCGVISDVSMPTYMLTHWVRDRTRGRRITLEQAVKCQTSETARTYGLLDRGILRPGYKADVNVIDFDNLRIHAPEIVYDLPANGRRLVQEASGYTATICNGEVIFENGEASGAMPGGVLRGTQAAPIQS